ncbi:heme peroxidase [Lentinula raphanica]|nr:heme peroxidase [Lentinula raphanica]
MIRAFSVPNGSVFITLALASHVHSFSTLQSWPNVQLAYAEKQLYEGSLTELAQLNCPVRVETTISAQWLRIAYHDMSTHNVDDGTGGLDASIQYERDRPQNVGRGMVDSLTDFGKSFNVIAPFFGMADTMALGAILGVAACGGPLIPFSAGRIDATEAGPATVPEPQQDLASHTESFRRQGFTPTEMISLVACGHTLGGVRQVDFPLVVVDPEDVLQTFDSTINFDNAVVSEYLQNTTQNVLVVGPNVTTRSDFRIFSSDGNVTMQSLLSSDTFNKTCGTLIERMLNTVPNGVTLTQPISEPFDYVVMGENPNRTVSMFWADRQGSSCPSTGCTVSSTDNQQVFFSVIGNIQGLSATRYLFNATINPATSISKFWFEVNENDGSDVIVVDNGGSGFVIEQDSIFVDNSRSQIVSASTFFTQLVVAARGDASSTVTFTTFNPFANTTTPPYLPVILTANLEVDESNPSEGGFTFFTTNISNSINFLNVTAKVGSTTYTQENVDMTVASLPLVEIS